VNRTGCSAASILSKSACERANGGRRRFARMDAKQMKNRKVVMARIVVVLLISGTFYSTARKITRDNFLALLSGNRVTSQRRP